jgi:hypothetical protein
MGELCDLRQRDPCPVQGTIMNSIVHNVQSVDVDTPRCQSRLVRFHTSVCRHRGVFIDTAVS